MDARRPSCCWNANQNLPLYYTIVFLVFGSSDDIYPEMQVMHALRQIFLRHHPPEISIIACGPVVLEASPQALFRSSGTPQYAKKHPQPPPVADVVHQRHQLVRLFRPCRYPERRDDKENRPLFHPIPISKINRIIICIMLPRPDSFPRDAIDFVPCIYSGACCMVALAGLTNESGKMPSKVSIVVSTNVA